MPRLTFFRIARSIGILFFSFLAIINCQAQESAYKVSFGLKGGFGLSTVRGSATDEYGATFSYSSRASVFGGLRLFVPTGRNGLFIPEMIVIVKSTMEQRPESPASQFNYNYNQPHNIFYVEMPLNMTYKKVSKAGQFFVGGGPAPAVQFMDEYLANGPIKSFDLGLNVLAGYQFAIGFSLELNYTHGLLKISSNADANVKMSNIGFSLGYAF